jgi:hypothetical protein
MLIYLVAADAEEAKERKRVRERNIAQGGVLWMAREFGDFYFWNNKKAHIGRMEFNSSDFHLGMTAR